MSEKTMRRISLISSIIMSVLIILVGILFICSAVGICQSGDQPYSPQSIAEAFQKIIIPVAICVIWALGAGILSLALRLPEKRLKGEPMQRAAIKRISKKAVTDGIQPAALSDIKRERRLRKIFMISLAVLYSIASLAALLYVFQPSSFASNDFNGDILKAALVLFACMAIPFAASVAYVFIASASMKRELALLKQVLVSQKSLSEKKKDDICDIRTSSKSTKKVLLCVRCAILALGVVLVFLGILNGGADDVLGKAIRICTECIGLG